jgi:hypothetical protein
VEHIGGTRLGRGQACSHIVPVLEEYFQPLPNCFVLRRKERRAHPIEQLGRTLLGFSEAILLHVD